jgi:hypothetical protein
MSFSVRVSRAGITSTANYYQPNSDEGRWVEWASRPSPETRLLQTVSSRTVQEVFDGDQKLQGMDWVLPDIFAPFRAEYYGEEHAFGTLWSQWVDDMVATAMSLKSQEASTIRHSASVSEQVDGLGA